MLDASVPTSVATCTEPTPLKTMIGSSSHQNVPASAAPPGIMSRIATIADNRGVRPITLTTSGGLGCRLSGGLTGQGPEVRGSPTGGPVDCYRSDTGV